MFAFVCICLYTSTGVFTTTNHQLGCCVVAPLCIHAGTAKSQFQLVLNCSNETTFEQLKILNVATSVSGMFCILVAIVIFVILVHYKVYNTTLQRLFLLLIIATILFEADMAMMIEHLFQYSGQEEFCAVLGYFNQSMSCMVFFFTAEIAVYLLFMVYKNVRGNPLPRLSKSKCLSRSVECISCLAPVLLPLAHSLFPYKRYGLSLFNCWIKTYDDACNKIGFTHQTITFCVLWGLSAVTIVATITLSIVYCIVAYWYRKLSQMVLLLRQTLFLIAFLVVDAVIITIGYVITLMTNEYIIHLLFTGPIYPLSLLASPLGYLLYLYTTINAHGIRSGCCCCIAQCCCKESPQRHDTYKTNPTSHPQNVPSDTFFVVEYTGCFTRISAADDTQQRTICTERENKLISHRHIPSNTYFDLEYTGEFTQIMEGDVKPDLEVEGQPLVSNNTDTGYDTMT